MFFVFAMAWVWFGEMYIYRPVVPACVICIMGLPCYDMGLGLGVWKWDRMEPAGIVYQRKLVFWELIGFAPPQ